jgi:dTMP kinase
VTGGLSGGVGSGSGGSGGLIAFEGIDGCGKTTQSHLLAGRLGALWTFEPGATGLGTALRALLLDRDQPPLDDRTEALLAAADRAQHVAEVVRPALDQGSWVVTDRFSASTLAYQGYGRGIARSELEVLIEWATRGLAPDLTVLVELSVGEASKRRSDKAEDRFERQGSPFLQRVADGYRHLAEEATTPWLVVDGSGTAEAVADAIWDGVRAVVEGPPAVGAPR